MLTHIAELATGLTPADVGAIKHQLRPIVRAAYKRHSFPTGTPIRNGKNDCNDHAGDLRKRFRSLLLPSTIHVAQQATGEDIAPNAAKA